MQRWQRLACWIHAFAWWRAVSDHLDEVRIRAASRCQVQLIADELAFVFHASLARAIHHAGGERKAICSARAFNNLVVELASVDCSRYAGAVLMKIQIGSSERAVRQRIAD